MYEATTYLAKERSYGSVVSLLWEVRDVERGLPREMNVDLLVMYSLFVFCQRGGYRFLQTKIIRLDEDSSRKTIDVLCP